MTKDLQLQMKERFDAVIDDLMQAGLFLEQAVEVIEKGMIGRSLRATNSNQCEAAKMLGIHRNTLLRKMVEFSIDGKRPRRKVTARKPAGRAQTKSVRVSRKVS